MNVCTYCHGSGSCAPGWRCVCAEPPWYEITLREIRELPEEAA